MIRLLHVIGSCLSAVALVLPAWSGSEAQRGDLIAPVRFYAIRRPQRRAQAVSVLPELSGDNVETGLPSSGRSIPWIQLYLTHDAQAIPLVALQAYTPAVRPLILGALVLFAGCRPSVPAGLTAIPLPDGRPGI